MIPHKSKRGTEAMNRLKVFDGVPPPYDKVSYVAQPIMISHTLLRLATQKQFIQLNIFKFNILRLKTLTGRWKTSRVELGSSVKQPQLVWYLHHLATLPQLLYEANIIATVLIFILFLQIL